MRWTRRWFLFVTAYASGFGAALLFFPHQLRLPFAPEEEMWVRILGMLLMAISVLELELARSGRAFMLRAGILHQALAACGLAYLTITRDDAAWARLVLVTVLIGLAGAAISYWREAASGVGEGDFVLLPRTARWNLYVTSYTAAYGILGVFAPLLIFPLLGLPRTDGLWVRLAGCAFLVLSHFNLEVYRAKGSARYILAIYVLRCFIFLVLLGLTLSGFSLGLLVAAATLAVGLVGTTVSYFPEMRRVRATTTP